MMLFLLFIFHIRMCKFWFSNYCFISVYFLEEDTHTHKANEIQHKISKSVFVTLTMNGVFHSLVRSFAYIRVRSILERKHTYTHMDIYVPYCTTSTNHFHSYNSDIVGSNYNFLYLFNSQILPFCLPAAAQHGTPSVLKFSLLIIQSSSAK